MDKIKKNDDFKINKTKGELDESIKRRNFFKFDYLKTTFKKEIIGGFSTFLAMLYILSVEPDILSKAKSVVEGGANMNAGGIFVATAVSAFIATLVMGLCSNLPVGLAPSMGLNAMFTFNIANNGIGYEGALIATLISSILFTIVSITKLRAILIRSIPHSLHLAIGVGIGFFIAYVGLTNIGWFKTNGGIPSAELSNFKLNYPGIILGTVILFGSVLLYFKKFIAPVAVMMLAGFILAIILANTTDDQAVQESFKSAKWVGWNYEDFDGVWYNLKNTFTQFGNANIWNKPIIYISIFIFVILNFFDATGTLKAINIEYNRITGLNTELTQKSLIIDAGATIGGSLLGVSHMSAYVESCVGISQGAKSGFANIITSLCFALSLALFPIFKMMPSCISGAATVFIGTVMMKSIIDIEWKKPEISLGAFLSIIFMITTYSIANGIALGLMGYTIGCIGTKKTKEIHPLLWFLDVVFILYFIAYAFIQ